MNRGLQLKKSVLSEKKHVLRLDLNKCREGLKQKTHVIFMCNISSSKTVHSWAVSDVIVDSTTLGATFVCYCKSLLSEQCCTP